MEEMRVQIEAREPTDGEIRAFWFTLPIDTEQVEEWKYHVQEERKTDKGKESPHYESGDA